MSRRKIDTRRMTVIAMMSAIAVIIYYLDIPIPFVPLFIKLDLSNVISLLAGFAFGPVHGILLCFIKNIIHLAIKGMGTTMGIGDMFDFITSSVFTFTASLVYMKNKTKKGAIMSCTIGTLFFAIISLPLNYFVVYPVYFKVYGGEQTILNIYKSFNSCADSLFTALCTFNLPFTFIKGTICSIVTIIIYKPLSPILKQRQHKRT